MRIALYIEDGLEQIVLTPESDTEKGIIGKLTDGSRQMSIKKGSFYKCNGGWMRYGASKRSTAFAATGYEWDDESTMIVLTPHIPLVDDPETILDGPTNLTGGK